MEGASRLEVLALLEVEVNDAEGDVMERDATDATKVNTTKADSIDAVEETDVVL